MSMNGQQSASWTSNELQRIADRQRWSLDVLSEKVGSLVRENVELMSIIQEMQRDLSELRAGTDVMAEEVLHGPA